jgi:hypothetical protein
MRGFSGRIRKFGDFKVSTRFLQALYSLSSDVEAEAKVEAPGSGHLLVEAEVEEPENMALLLPLSLTIAVWILVDYFAQFFLF